MESSSSITFSNSLRHNNESCPWQPLLINRSTGPPEIWKDPLLFKPQFQANKIPALFLFLVTRRTVQINKLWLVALQKYLSESPLPQGRTFSSLPVSACFIPQTKWTCTLCLGALCKASSPNKRWEGEGASGVTEDRKPGVPGVPFHFCSLGRIFSNRLKQTYVYCPSVWESCRWSLKTLGSQVISPNSCVWSDFLRRRVQKPGVFKENHYPGVQFYKGDEILVHAVQIPPSPEGCRPPRGAASNDLVGQ